MRARASCGERLSRGCESKRTGSTRAYLWAGCARIYIFVHTGSCQVSRSNSCKPFPHLHRRQMPPRSRPRLMHRSRRHWSRRNCQPRKSQNRLCCSCRTRRLPQRACYRNHPPPLLQVDLSCVLRPRAKICVAGRIGGLSERRHDAGGAREQRLAHRHRRRRRAKMGRRPQTCNFAHADTSLGCPLSSRGMAVMVDCSGGSSSPSTAPPIAGCRERWCCLKQKKSGGDHKNKPHNHTRSPSIARRALS